MTITVTPSESEALSTLGDYFDEILPAGVVSVVGQANRVAEPRVDNFVVMTPIRRKRLETNIDQFVDVFFTGAIAGTLLTVTAVAYGKLKSGSILFGSGLANPTQVVSQVSGAPGGVGTYTVTPSQTVASEPLAAGVLNALQPTELTIQVDVHGSSGGDNAQIISTMLRDDHAVQFFIAVDKNVVPFYADDPKQVPFINENEQYEDRWIVEACLQVNATVNDVPQQFFDKIVVTLIPADIVEPA